MHGDIINQDSHANGASCTNMQKEEVINRNVYLLNLGLVRHKQSLELN